MPGTKGHSGGTRPGAGRKPTYRKIELTETTAKELAHFIDDLNLDPKEVHVIVSTLVSQALHEQGDRWRDVFGNALNSKIKD